MARPPSHGHRKAYHRHDVSFLMGRVGVAAVQLHLARLAGGDPAAEANLLEVQSLIPHRRCKSVMDAVVDELPKTRL